MKMRGCLTLYVYVLYLYTRSIDAYRPLYIHILRCTSAPELIYMICIHCVLEQPLSHLASFLFLPWLFIFIRRNKREGAYSKLYRNTLVDYYCLSRVDLQKPVREREVERSASKLSSAPLIFNPQLRIIVYIYSVQAHTDFSYPRIINTYTYMRNI